ncbi:MAG: glycosyl hydrolase [Bacteroidales bacterium]|nr:glycosyl hydrolase [Bacteroidales bacterium]
MQIKQIFLASVFILSFCTTTFSQEPLNSGDFQSPPQSSKVHTWWHWMSGNISKEGISKDLESMELQGISQATILNIGSWIPMNIIDPPVKFNSEEWYEMYKWALEEASRLGIKIGLHNCDGWSTSGGPWITPEKSMKQYVWTKTTINGGGEINVKLPQPQALHDFYRDVTVVAYPIKEKLNSYQEAKPKVSLNARDLSKVLHDGNPLSEEKIKTGESIQLSFPSEFTAEKMVIFPRMVFEWGDMRMISSKFILSESNDGVQYNDIKEFELTGVNQAFTVIFPKATAKYYRLKCVEGWINYAVSEIELLKLNERQIYLPEIDGLLKKTVNVKAVAETDFSASTQNFSKGISENTIVNLTSSVSPEGILNWKAPKGQWRVIRFGYTTTGKTTGPATPEGTGLEVDKMDTEALDFHFDSFAKKLIQASGTHTGNTFKFLLIDSWECFFQNWSKDFPDEFNKRRGYDLTNWIPVLCGETVENTKLSEAFLHDFNKTIADLIDEKYFKHFRELCHENNLEMHAEIIYGDDGSYPPLDILKSNNYPDMPMTEFWSNPDRNQFPEYQPTVRPKVGFPTFAALACNKQIIGSEAYTGFAHYSESPFDLKPFGDAAFCSGINQMILHSYVHQPTDDKPGMTLMKFGAHFNRNNPWWEFARGWMDYQARIQYVLQKGEPVVDIIFYVGDQLPEYFSKSIVNDLPYGFQASACNLNMLNNAVVNDGQLSFGGKQHFPILTLPKTTRMEFATLTRIAELVNDGALVYGPKPLEMLSVPEIREKSGEFKKLADELWGSSSENNYGKGKVISGKAFKEVLAQLELRPDFSTDVGDPKELMFIHKKMDDAEVYFVFNQQEETLSRDIVFRVKNKTPEIWDAELGTTSATNNYSQDENGLKIPVTFKPYESKFFVFREKKSSKKDGKTLDKTLETENYVDLKSYKAKLEFFPISNETIMPLEITELKSLSEFDDPAIQYFAGKVKYTIEFNSPEGFENNSNSLSINLGEMDATAEVRLNGEFLKYAWIPNSNIPISGLLKEGNILEIQMATVCRNRFIGDLIHHGEVKSLSTTSPITTILTPEMPLKPSGLMGPLKLIQYK